MLSSLCTPYTHLNTTYLGRGGGVVSEALGGVWVLWPGWRGAMGAARMS